ncbi:MAG: DUF4013 domain-containing protein [Candidatus Aureabacteria bacterium]|nr:DUF4013 domain-containing protein [Candidatus Auribacterota bacterium]MCK5161697.1 DUF4013 domain-containing protein [Candidatus Auribacterota bacterium]
MRFNIEQAFKYPFKDEKWVVKILLLGIIMFIPIVNILAAGYLLRFIKSSVAEHKGGAEAKLPEWEDWGNLFQEGIYPWIIALVYTVVFFMAATVIGWMPCIGTVVSVLLSLVLGPVVFIALVRYCKDSKIEDAFKVVDIFNEFKTKALDYILASLIGSVVCSLGILACCVGIIFTAPFGKVVAIRMLSDVYACVPEEKQVEQKPEEKSEENRE